MQLDTVVKRVAIPTQCLRGVVDVYRLLHAERLLTASRAMSLEVREACVIMPIPTMLFLLPQLLELLRLQGAIKVCQSWWTSRCSLPMLFYSCTMVAMLMVMAMGGS